MNELIFAIERAIELLNKSRDAAYANKTVDAVKNVLEKELKQLKEKQKFNLLGKSKIKFLFLPTGTLQEISMRNDWMDEYLEISKSC